MTVTIRPLPIVISLPPKTSIIIPTLGLDNPGVLLMIAVLCVFMVGTVPNFAVNAVIPKH